MSNDNDGKLLQQEFLMREVRRCTELGMSRWDVLCTVFKALDLVQVTDTGEDPPKMEIQMLFGLMDAVVENEKAKRPSYVSEVWDSLFEESYREMKESYLQKSPEEATPPIVRIMQVVKNET